MTEAPSPFPAYVAALPDALGGRDPFEVLAGTPETLPRAVTGLTPELNSDRNRPASGPCGRPSS